MLTGEGHLLEVIRLAMKEIEGMRKDLVESQSLR
jgi:hypothetical protein